MSWRYLKHGILISALLSFAYSAEADRKPKSCAIKSAMLDYQSYFDIKSNINFRVQTYKVKSTNTSLVLLADTLSCGSKGCDYLLYEELGPGCFRRLADFAGHIKFQEPSKQGHYPTLWLGIKNQAIESSYQTQYEFDSNSKTYAENKKFRKNWNGTSK